MRIIDGNTIETECDSCASTFTCGRGEDGHPDELLCFACRVAWQELRAELAKERDRVWFETFLSFPFKALPAPNRVLEELDWAHDTAAELKAWREYQDFMDAADQAACYSPGWRDEDARTGGGQ